MTPIRKYPRTRHLAGSALQPGDEDLPRADIAELRGRHLVVEEKLDGANAAVSFTPDGRLLLQSRGHYLVGGPRERHFDRLKAFAAAHKEQLWRVLGARYVVYGEWLYAKHTIFYDRLPEYFVEFDVLDREADEFLSTARRLELLAPLGLAHAPVLAEGPLGREDELRRLIGPSRFKSPAWRETLGRAAAMPPHDAGMVMAQTDPSDLMEGLYIKVEGEGRVLDRLKLVRAGFLQTVADSESHWQSRPILPNQLAAAGSSGMSP
jgi:hypothetical protein